MINFPIVKNIDKELEMTKALNTEIYHDVHCRPYSEYRHNIRLFPLFQEPKVNLFTILSTSIRLPASGRWFLYTVEENEIVDINLPHKTEWMNLVDYCNEYRVDIRFILTGSYLMIPRAFIYVIRNPRYNNYIFAVNKKVYSALLGSDANTESIRSIDLNFYYHHIGEYFKIESYSDNSRTTSKNTFFNAMTATSDYPKMVFMDGKEVTVFNDNKEALISVNDISDTSVGEIVYDSSIVGSFNVEIDTTDDAMYSNSNGSLNILCHIPKALNPNNNILNSRVCDIYVHPRSTHTTHYKEGIYINRTKTEEYIQTITHNDFGISYELASKYLSINSSNYTGILKVYVRNHKKGIVLGKCPSHIKSLYLLDDDLIKYHLLGREKISIWTAANIAKSKWAYLMDNYLEGVTATSFNVMVEALGYVNAANTICQRVQHILISNELNKQFYIPVPLCYLNEDSIAAHVFIDGELIDEDRYKLSKQKQFLVLRFDDRTIFTVGQRISVELFEHNDYKCRELEISAHAKKTLIIDKDYLIYKVLDQTEGHKLPNNPIYNRFSDSTTKLYKEFTSYEYNTYVTTSTDEDDAIHLTISNTTDSVMKILVTSANAYSKIYGVERHMKELNYDIWCSHMLKIKAGLFPEVTESGIEDVTNKYVTIPYLNTNKNMLVYFNGKELIKNVDYNSYTLNAINANRVFKDLKVTGAGKNSANGTYKVIKYEHGLTGAEYSNQEATIKMIPDYDTSGERYIWAIIDNETGDTLYKSSASLEGPWINATNASGTPTVSAEYSYSQDDSTAKNSGYYAGQFIIIQNADYIRLVSNTIEVFSINEDIATLDYGFMTASSTDSIMSHMSFYKNIAALFVEGKLIKTASDDNYYVELAEDIRKGASYKIRALIPQCLKSVIGKYATDDTSTISSIVSYLNKTLPSSTVITPIEKSHHIYSTFLQSITELVLRKKLTIDNNWTDDEIKQKLKPYESIMDFDISFNANNKEITDKNEFVKQPEEGLDYRFVDVLPSYRLEKLDDTDLDIVEKRPIMIISGSSRNELNGIYICMNPGLEYMKDTTARHMNENAYKQWSNQNSHSHIGHTDNYWRLYDINDIECYKAHDNMGVIDIWNLKWEPVNPAYNDISIRVVYVEVNTANEFSIHRLQYTRSVEEYAFLQRIAKLYLKQDLAKDGMNI